MFMIIGKIPKNEKMIKFDREIHCTNCGKQVPGGLKTGEKYYESHEFEMELKGFLKNYLCGICRDRKRVSKN
jgi:hypothetical protein